MAVLVEAISVIVRKSAIEEKIEGGWDGFVETIPNSTLCHDEDLACVGFLSPIEVESYIDRLRCFGLVFLQNGEARDIAVVDQQRGPTTKVPWLEFTRFRVVNDGEGLMSACWLWDDERSHGAGIYFLNRPVFRGDLILWVCIPVKLATDSG